MVTNVEDNIFYRYIKGNGSSNKWEYKIFFLLEEMINFNIINSYKCEILNLNLNKSYLTILKFIS